MHHFLFILYGDQIHAIFHSLIQGLHIPVTGKALRIFPSGNPCIYYGIQIVCDRYFSSQRMVAKLIVPGSTIVNSPFSLTDLAISIASSASFPTK